VVLKRAYDLLQVDLKPFLSESDELKMLYRREIGLGLFKPAKLFLSGIILDLFTTDSYRYKTASV